MGGDLYFHNSIIGNLMIDQDRNETDLLQLFAIPEYSEWFSKFMFLFLRFLRSTLLLNRNKHVGNNFFFFISFHCPQPFHSSLTTALTSLHLR